MYRAWKSGFGGQNYGIKLKVLNSVQDQTEEQMVWINNRKKN